MLIRSKVGGLSKPSLCFAGWDRLGTFKGKRVKNLWKSVESVGQQQGRNCQLISYYLPKQKYFFLYYIIM